MSRTAGWLRSPDRGRLTATHDLAIFIDEYVISADTGLLVGQECAMSLGELLKEIVTPIGDRLGEVDPVRLLKSEHG